MASVAGLGFLIYDPRENGGGDFWGFNDPFWGFNDYSGGGGDFWGFDDPFWGNGGGDYYDPATNTFRFYDSDRFLPANQPQPNSNWQALLDWWAELTGNLPHSPAYDPNLNLPGYCPAGTYHPLDDPFACVPFPIDPVTGRQQAPRPRPAATQPQRKPSAPKVSAQNPQPCPPPGRTNPQTGRCECPQGLVYNTAQRRCVQATLTNRLVSEGPGGLPWWALLLIGAVVLKAAKGSGGRR